MTGKWGEIQGKWDLIRVSGHEEVELSEFEICGSTVNKKKGPNSGKHVYHLRIGSRCVNANDKQNSGLVNFVLESRVPFAQISSIYRKTAAKG